MIRKIGLFGCGRWGRHILRDLLDLNAEVHVCCLNDQTIERALQMGATTAGQEIKAIDQLDGFVVATPTDTHAAVLQKLLVFKKPIFVEKPLTAEVKSARDIALKANGRVFVMEKWRYHPAVEKARQLACAGDLGDILAIKTERCQWAHPHTDVSALWILAPHDLSIMSHILGFIPPVKHAIATIVGRPDLGIKAVLGYTTGTQIHMEIGIASPSNRRSLTVIGSKATFEMSGSMDNSVTLSIGAPGDKSAKTESLPLTMEMPLYKELEAFMNYLSGTAEAPMSSVENGLIVVERLAEIEDMAGKN